MSRLPFSKNWRRAFTVLFGGAPRSGQSASFAGREVAEVLRRPGLLLAPCSRPDVKHRSAASLLVKNSIWPARRAPPKGAVKALRSLLYMAKRYITVPDTISTTILV